MVAPDLNKFVKPISESIRYNNFIILAICYSKVLQSLGVLDPHGNEQLWKKDFPESCDVFCSAYNPLLYFCQGVFTSFLPKQTTLCPNL